jgi:hypothetical protein
VRRVCLGHRHEHVPLPVVDDVDPVASGRFHRDVAHDLQEVVLDDVAQRADRIVEVAAIAGVEVLAHRDLNGRDEVPVPDGLEDRVGEPEVEDVLDGHLPEVVVDAVQLGLVDELVELLVEGARRGEVVAERLLDDDTGVMRETRLRESADDSAEEGRRDLEVEDRRRRSLDRFRDLRVRGVVGEVAVDVREATDEPLENPVVDLLAGGADRVVRPLDEMLVRPVVEGDTDDGAVEEPARLEAVQRAEGHDPREIARDAEDHENVGRLRPTVRLPVHTREHFSSYNACSRQAVRSRLRL